MTRQFTIQTQSVSQVLTLSTANISVMDLEYPDAYTDLFQSAYTRMIRCHKLKLHAIKYVNNHMDKFNTSMNVKML